MHSFKLLQTVDGDKYSSPLIPTLACDARLRSVFAQALARARPAIAARGRICFLVFMVRVLS